MISTDILGKCLFEICQLQKQDVKLTFQSTESIYNLYPLCVLSEQAPARLSNKRTTSMRIDSAIQMSLRTGYFLELTFFTSGS